MVAHVAVRQALATYLAELRSSRLITDLSALAMLEGRLCAALFVRLPLLFDFLELFLVDLVDCTDLVDFFDLVFLLFFALGMSIET